MTNKIIAGLLGIAVLAGCDNGLADSKTRSGFAWVPGTTVDASLGKELNGSVSRTSVGTVAYVSGLDNKRGQAVALAGIAPGANVGSAVTSGSATYSTTYGYTVIDNVYRTDPTFSKDGEIGGSQREETGLVTLTADFDKGTLTGSTSGIDVNGTISGSDVGGSVTTTSGPSRTVQGASLDGNIGSTGVIGAFHGSDGNTTVAGGLVGTRN